MGNNLFTVKEKSGFIVRLNAGMPYITPFLPGPTSSPTCTPTPTPTPSPTVTPTNPPFEITNIIPGSIRVLFTGVDPTCTNLDVQYSTSGYAFTSNFGAPVSPRVLALEYPSYVVVYIRMEEVDGTKRRSTNIVSYNIQTSSFNPNPIIPTQTPTCTPSPTQTPTNTPTITQTPSNTPTNTQTPSNTPTATPTCSITVTQTPSQTPTSTPTNTPTSTQTPSVTPSSTQFLTPTPTTTCTPTPTVTPTNTFTPTVTPSTTQTPSQTHTPTLSQTPTQTSTTTQTPTNTRTPTCTPSNTVTQTPTSSKTPTPSVTPSSTSSTVNVCISNTFLSAELSGGWLDGTYTFNRSVNASPIYRAVKGDKTFEFYYSTYFNINRWVLGDTSILPSYTYFASVATDKSNPYFGSYINVGGSPDANVVVGACSTPTPTPTVTQTPTNTQTPTQTSTTTQTPTNTITPTNTQTLTVTQTPTNTQTPTSTQAASPTVTPSPTQTPTVSQTPTNTSTPTQTLTPTQTPSQTVPCALDVYGNCIPTPTPTHTPTATPIPAGYNGLLCVDNLQSLSPYYLSANGFFYSVGNANFKNNQYINDFNYSIDFLFVNPWQWIIRDPSGIARAYNDIFEDTRIPPFSGWKIFGTQNITNITVVTGCTVPYTDNSTITMAISSILPLV